jgi:alkanesulfonate monooxygenase SsuD/methylene tetrahydromethanopterin reductase-like flavin-dependent oxidoreductase (luciferase family)
MFAHCLSSKDDFLAANYFVRIARTLEDSRFDMAFFGDRPAMPDLYRATTISPSVTASGR